MSTNPSNAIGTNGAYGGRTSVNAFNDVLGAFTSRGIISGWAASPDSGLDITIGGDGSTRDVAVAEDNIGNKTTINNISEDPVSITIPAAPATNSRIDLVVAYVDNPAQGSSTETDNPGACGLIVVSGTAASTPSDPTDADIRTAITADGGAGTIAYYVILAKVKIASGTTDITSNMITQGATVNLGDNTVVTNSIANSSIKSNKIDWTTIRTQLYNNTTGTTGTVNLSQSAANFNHIDIYFRTNDGENETGFQRVYSPNGKTTSLVYIAGGGTINFIKRREITISGSSITNKGFNTYAEIKIDGGNVTTDNSNVIYITRVEGWTI